MNKNHLKYNLVFKIGMFLFIYLFFISFLCKDKIIFFLLSAYFFVRILFDFILIIVSLFNDISIRHFIEKITNKKVPFERPWEERSLGIFKWLIYNYVILFAAFLINSIR